MGGLVTRLTAKQITLDALVRVGSQTTRLRGYTLLGMGSHSRYVHDEVWSGARPVRPREWDPPMPKRLLCCIPEN